MSMHTEIIVILYPYSVFNQISILPFNGWNSLSYFLIIYIIKETVTEDDRRMTEESMGNDRRMTEEIFTFLYFYDTII